MEYCIQGVEVILSHSHKFIFIKTIKTAGTSIEVALSQLCDEGDVVTPIIPPVKGHNPRNYDGFWNHISASDVAKRVPAEVWNSYFKFTFERNPWDKTVSLFWFLKDRFGFEENFTDYCIRSFLGSSPLQLPVLTTDYFKYRLESLRWWIRNKDDKNYSIQRWVYDRLGRQKRLPSYPSDFYRYAIDGEVAVDYVGKFETLVQDMEFICNKFNLPFEGLPNAKGNSSRKGRKYKEQYNDLTRDMVAFLFRKEIRLFDYTFD